MRLSKKLQLVSLILLMLPISAWVIDDIRPIDRKYYGYDLSDSELCCLLGVEECAQAWKRDATGNNIVFFDEKGRDTLVVLRYDLQGRENPVRYPLFEDIMEATENDSSLHAAFPAVYGFEKVMQKKDTKPAFVNYINTYLQAAIEEEEKSGVPYYLTLAQGLLESNAGRSKLAKQNNNHFGIKCYSRECKRGHCTNFEDDSHKDFFRKYSTVAESFSAHSQVLKAERYKKLFLLDKSDYKAWAKGVKTCGYATDKRYDVKLIKLIEDYGLHLLN